MPVQLYIAPIAMEGRGIMIDNHNRKFHGDFSSFVFVDSIEECDFVVMPKSITRVSPARAAIEKGKNLAAQYGKQLIMFYYGDRSDREHVPGVIAFKWAAHAFDKLPTEVITPVFFPDLATERPVKWRNKGEVPTVGFCGYADFTHVKTALKYHVQNGLINVVSLATNKPYLKTHKRGLYFRRKSMRVLARDPRINTQFIVRPAFYNQVNAPQQQIRNEYLDNLQNADFVLAPRGDTNTSTRFFEALSLGQIPILIDTECVLPLEKYIDYDSFILRVPHTEMHLLPEYVLEFYRSLSNEEFIAMQQRARAAYEQFLEVGPFFNYVFPLLKEKGPEAL